MARKIFSITGCPLSLETVQEYINYEVYDYVADIPEGETQEGSSVVATYTCHICATSMPVNSVLTHLVSDIHRMWQSVAELAAERLRRQASAALPLAPAPPPDTVFCETCGVHVQDNHKCSEEYTTREVTLKRFLQIYQKSATEAEDIDVESNDGLATSNEYEQSDVEVEAVAGTEEVESPIVSSNKVPMVSNEVPYAEDEDHIDTSRFVNRFILNQINTRKLSQVEIQMLKYYAYISKNQDYSHNIIIHNAEYVDIVTPMGDCVRVTEEKYHGFVTVNGRTLCRVCRYLVRDKAVHMRTEAHIEKIRCPLIDRNCIRELNSLWNHCVLCNEIIENVEFHVTCSETHKSILSKALVAPGCLIFEGPHGIELIECLMCAQTVEKEDLRCHATSAEHKKRLREKRLQLGDEDPIFNHHHLQISEDRVRCRVCKTELHEDADKIANHVYSKKHTDLYQAILQQGRIKQVQSKLQCKVCAVELTDDTVLQHIATEDHDTNIKELPCGVFQSPQRNLYTPKSNEKPANKKLNSHYSRTEDPDKVWCKVCLVFLKYDRRIMLAHRKREPNHTKIYNNKLKVNKMQRKKGTKFECEACNVVVRKMNVVDHWLSGAHKTQLKQLNVSTSRRLPNKSKAKDSIENKPSADVQDSAATISDCDPTAVEAAVNNTEHKSKVSGPHSAVTSESSRLTKSATKSSTISCETAPIPSKMIANNLFVPSKKWIECNICNYKFANTACNFKTHLYGVQHSFNLESLLKKNNIVGHSPRYKCTDCGLKLRPNNVIDHINNHTSTDSQAALVNAAVSAAAVKPNLQTEGTIEVMKNRNEVYCKACNIRITNCPANISEHIRGRRHATITGNVGSDKSVISEEKEDFLSGVRELQAELERGVIIKLTKDGQNRYCNACGCIILIDPMVHVRDPKHIIAYDAIMAAHKILRNFL